MRICLYTSTALPKLGGQEAVVDALARHFQRLGHEPVVLAPRPRLPLRPDDGKLPYPVLRHPRLYSTRRFVGLYRRWLMAAHARHRFDVIHCHDVYPTGYLAALSKDRLGVPVAITSHGGDVREGNIRISKPGMRERYVRAARAADALISIGRFTEDGFRRLYPDTPRIVTIPNGIDLEPFDRAAPRPAGLDPAIREGDYVLFLGRLKHRKGVDLLLRAMAHVPAGDGVQLVVAGSGEDRAALEQQVSERKLGDRVRLVGRVEGEEKLFLLQNARCVVMPSRVWEAFPLVILEAYAAGKPVIGTAIPGIVDLIRQDETGLLVPPEDEAALGQAITALLTDPAQAQRMGDAARSASRAYSWDSVARRHVDLYQSLQVTRKGDYSSSAAGCFEP